MFVYQYISNLYGDIKVFIVTSNKNVQAFHLPVSQCLKIIGGRNQR